YPDSTAVNYSYDVLSHLTQASDPSGTYSFAYDNMGRETGTTVNYSFLSGQNLTTGYSYDAASNIKNGTDRTEGSGSSFRLAAPERLAFIGILFGAFLVYAPTLTYQFVYDDDFQILKNPHIQSW